MARLVEELQSDFDLAQPVVVFGKQVGRDLGFPFLSGDLLDDGATTTPSVEKSDDRWGRDGVQIGERYFDQAMFVQRKVLKRAKS
jgi:hypothetical protein